MPISKLLQELKLIKYQLLILNITITCFVLFSVVSAVFLYSHDNSSVPFIGKIPDTVSPAVVTLTPETDSTLMEKVVGDLNSVKFELVLLEILVGSIVVVISKVLYP